MEAEAFGIIYVLETLLDFAGEDKATSISISTTDAEKIIKLLKQINMSKQTAVEWLQEQLNPDMKTMQGHIIQDLLDQAKAMEKEQLLDMGNQFAIMGEDSPEQYYTETFKSE